jgi:hypothetical protein
VDNLKELKYNCLYIFTFAVLCVSLVSIANVHLKSFASAISSVHWKSLLYQTLSDPNVFTYYVRVFNNY